MSLVVNETRHKFFFDTRKGEAKVEGVRLEDRSEISEKATPQIQIVAEDVLYTEVYSELRRYRDNTFLWQKWYTTTILATMGGVFLLHEKSEAATIPFFKVFSIAFIVVLTLMVELLIRYTRRRYRRLMAIAMLMEPEWRRSFLKYQRQPGDTKDIKFLRPGELFLWVNRTIALASCVMIFKLPPLTANSEKAMAPATTHIKVTSCEGPCCLSSTNSAGTTGQSPNGSGGQPGAKATQNLK